MSSISNLTVTNGPLWNQPENHGPVVSVMTWLLIVTTFLAVLARIATRLVVVHTIRLDDISILLALVRVFIPAPDLYHIDRFPSCLL